MPFQKLGLPPSLLHNIRALGYRSPTPVQAQAIPAVQAGRDLVATAQTGSGKTAAFLLPVAQHLLSRPRGKTGALVLTPTRELAQQVDAVFRGLAAGTPLRSALVVGGAAQAPQERALRAGVDLVVATPGRLLALLNEGHGDLAGLRTLVLDEADQMFDMGFFPDLKRILAFLPSRRQTLLFSATMPPEVARLGRTVLRDPLTVAVGPPGKAAQEVTQVAYPVPAHRKTALLGHLLRRDEMRSVLVFTRTRRGAKRLARSLSESGHEVEQLHADRSPGQRARAMEGFRAGAFPVLVATNVAARGIDVRHITHVVNYDVPAAPEEYVHRIGRTGRAGDTGDALVLVAPEENALLARIERQLGHSIPRRRLTDFDYAAAAPPPAVKQRRQPAAAPTGRGKRPPSRRRRR
jgi:ATP-dependent RNA helicase RhlE